MNYILRLQTLKKAAPFPSSQLATYWSWALTSSKDSILGPFCSLQLL